MGDERVAEICHPAHAGQPLDSRPDEVDGVRRRRGHDDVDPLAANEADRGRDGRQAPGHVLVRDERPASEQARVRRSSLQASRPVQLVGGTPAARTDVAGAVHPGLRRRLEVVVTVDPPGVVRCEHVGLDPERRQVGRELERTLHAASTGRGPVHGHEENLHRRRW
jgi:hypothetical protein